MDSEEYIDFLKSLLIKIENALNLIEQTPSKHIPSYHKVLGVQQKLAGLDIKYREKLFPKLVKTRGIINHLTNGRYEEAHAQMLELKIGLTIIYSEMKNEKDTVQKT